VAGAVHLGHLDEFDERIAHDQNIRGGPPFYPPEVARAEKTNGTKIRAPPFAAGNRTFSNRDRMTSATELDESRLSPTANNRFTRRTTSRISPSGETSTRKETRP